MTKSLQHLGLFLARFCTSAWIGAATLFVIVGVAEVTRGGFDSTVKDSLVAIRFPAFYCFGAALVGTALVGTLLVRDTALLRNHRRILAAGLLFIVIAIMAIDYVWIYLPLLAMVTPPGAAKPASFRSYHESSKWVNLAGLAICLAATLLINWPCTAKKSGMNSDQ